MADIKFECSDVIPESGKELFSIGVNIGNVTKNDVELGTTTTTKPQY